MRLFIAALASICFFASAQSEQPDFYSDKQRGWFWHETEPEQPEETEYQKTTRLIVKSLRSALRSMLTGLEKT
ncbi:hypothetical protein L3081_24800 [Colwellia sp. MSW7]|uniref:Type-F conjugative transfer system pilin assembly protein TraF n=1 Tax=Colwellia maritima TaxID=2912588 RepID=A0ABS9X728_9GAMM|nr:hypothetical protein [Colwellia maritima]MCI2286045.1 hypothetical protein [Colwellia maritima]